MQQLKEGLTQWKPAPAADNAIPSICWDTAIPNQQVLSQIIDKFLRHKNQLVAANHPDDDLQLCSLRDQGLATSTLADGVHTFRLSDSALQQMQPARAACEPQFAFRVRLEVY